MGWQFSCNRNKPRCRKCPTNIAKFCTTGPSNVPKGNGRYYNDHCSRKSVSNSDALPALGFSWIWEQSSAGADAAWCMWWAVNIQAVSPSYTAAATKERCHLWQLLLSPPCPLPRHSQSCPGSGGHGISWHMWKLQPGGQENDVLLQTSGQATCKDKAVVCKANTQ